MEQYLKGGLVDLINAVNVKVLFLQYNSTVWLNMSYS